MRPQGVVPGRRKHSGGWQDSETYRFPSNRRSRAAHLGVAAHGRRLPIAFGLTRPEGGRLLDGDLHRLFDQLRLFAGGQDH